MTVKIKLSNATWSYDPTKPLGQRGGFGQVFRGQGEKGEPVAVKRLHIEAASAAHRELEIAKELASRDLKHVVPILDAGQDSESNGYFIVMPIADRSLQDYLDREGPRDERETVQILTEIGAGLAEVKDLVHRDLKPANVLQIGGSWRVADFGIARFVEDATSTRTLRDCLSPEYAAPEQWRYERATAATDLYALGCMTYTLLTGAPPFQGDIAELQERHLRTTPSPIPATNPQFRTLASMLLRKSPASRPSLNRVLTILTQVRQPAHPNTDPALLRLADAAAAHEAERAAAEAREEQARAARTRRVDLAREAKGILESVFSELVERVRGTVATAEISSLRDSRIIRVGGASLELDLTRTGAVFDEPNFPRSKWDVICGAVIEAGQTNPRFVRSASLWYTKQANPRGVYRWYEVGYRGNPLAGRGFPFEPSAADAELADRAHWAGMDVITTSYGPMLVDDEETDNFCRRWAEALAEAAAGRLQAMAGAIANTHR